MSPFRRYTLADWLEHIQTRHWRTVDLQLDRIAEVWKRLPGGRGGLVITVAGTNGKGSCVAMLEAVLRNAGLKTGSYTSPHLVRYNERIRVDGEAADDAELCATFAQIERARNGVPLTYFEFGTLCALLIFARRRVDVSLLEVGMGGRLDAVNLISNDIALITSIGIDHASWLGASREAIAAQKAGVLKNNARAVCAEPRPPHCIAQIAAQRNCMLLQNGRDYRLEPPPAGPADGELVWHSEHPAIAPGWRRIAGLRAPFNGAHQANNLGGVVAVLALTRGRTGVTRQNLVDGLAAARLAARCQVLGGTPEIILDVAHNPDSAADLAAFLRHRQTAGKTLGILGVLADKPVGGVLEAMDGVVHRWYLATLAGERGQTARKLNDQLAVTGSASPATLHDSPVAAAMAAVAEAGACDRLVMFGSFHTAGAIMAHLEHTGDWTADAFRHAPPPPLSPRAPPKRPAPKRPTTSP